MASISELRAQRQAAWHILETELAKLKPLTEQMERTGIVPPGWDEQKESVKIAQSAFDRAMDAYVEALRQRPNDIDTR